MVSLLNNSNHVIQACPAGLDPKKDDPVGIDKGDRAIAERAALPREYLLGRAGRNEHLRSGRPRLQNLQVPQLRHQHQRQADPASGNHLPSHRVSQDPLLRL